MKAPRSILITGASSGIGAALARGYAAPGITLSLCGRDAGRLDQVVAACRAAGAAVDGRILDVTDTDAVQSWIERCDADAVLDLVIANAGVSGGAKGGGESATQARRIFATNFDGVMNTVLPALPLMQGRGRGQIAIMSSIAAFRGSPGAPAYSASKAAVRSWGEALRGALARDGIEVSVICPGFVESRMTADNAFPMPFLMTADKAAGIIRRGLARNRGRIAFPFPMYFMAWLVAAMPAVLGDRLLRALPKKG